MLLPRGDLRTSIVMTAGTWQRPYLQTATNTLTVIEGQLLIGLAVPKVRRLTEQMMASWNSERSNTEYWRWEFFILPRDATL